jgi:(2R)-ethylmalonyl-CoA mutase
MQQIVAHETDLLEYGDIFDGSLEIDNKVEELKTQARAELGKIEKMGGAVAAIDYMKSELVKANTARLHSIESGEKIVVGVNKWTESAPSPLAGEAGGIVTVPESVELEQIAKLKEWRARRDAHAVEAALAELNSAAREDRNIMEASIACARAGVTTGEWGACLREVFGEYRAPTGVSDTPCTDEVTLDDLRARVREVSGGLGRTLTFLVGKPGLDGHSNGAEQIAVRARDIGMDVVYEGIRLTPKEIVDAAEKQNAHVIGLSILSGSHVPLVRDVMALMRERGMADVPVIVGGIIPEGDENILRQVGVARIYTPKDFKLNTIMGDIVELAGGRVS